MKCDDGISTRRGGRLFLRAKAGDDVVLILTIVMALVLFCMIQDVVNGATSVYLIAHGRRRVSSITGLCGLVSSSERTGDCAAGQRTRRSSWREHRHSKSPHLSSTTCKPKTSTQFQCRCVEASLCQ